MLGQPLREALGPRFRIIQNGKIYYYNPEWTGKSQAVLNLIHTYEPITDFRALSLLRAKFTRNGISKEKADTVRYEKCVHCGNVKETYPPEWYKE